MTNTDRNISCFSFVSKWRCQWPSMFKMAEPVAEYLKWQCQFQKHVPVAMPVQLFPAARRWPEKTKQK